jgi:uncharacterized protein YhaN
MPKQRPLQLQSLSLEWGPAGYQKKLSFDAFSPGINLLVGPNASGKTTTARAIRKLLWNESTSKEDDYLQRSNLQLQAKLNDEQWSLEFSYGSQLAQLGGATTSNPQWSAGISPDRYHLALHDLLRADDGNLAEQIHQEMMGGFDLDSVRDELAYSNHIPPKTIGQYQNFDEARNRKQEIQQELKGLADQEERLNELEQQLKEYRRFEQRKQGLEKLLTFAEQQRQYDELKHSMERYDSILEEINGTEFEQLQKLNRSISEAERKQTTLRERRSKLQKEQEALPLDPDALSDATLRRWSQQVQELDQLEKAIRDQENQVAELNTRYENQQRVIQDLEWPEEWHRPQPSDFKTLEKLITRQLEHQVALEQLQQSEQLTEKRLDDLGELPNGDHVRESLTQLRRLFRIPDESDTPQADSTSLLESKWAYLALAFTAIAAAGSFFVGWWLLVVGIVAGAGLLWWSARGQSEDNSIDWEREQNELLSELQRLGVITLQDTQDAHLRDALDQLFAYLQQLEQRDQLRDQRERIQQEMAQHKAKLDEIDQQLEQLRQAFGVLPEMHSEAALYQFVQQVAALNEIQAKRAGAQEKLNQLRNQREEQFQSLKDKVGAGTTQEYSISDTEALSQLVGQLSEQWDQWSSLQQDQAQLESQLESLETQLESTRRDRTELLAKFPEETSADQIQSWCEQHSEYQELRAETKAAHRALNQAREHALQHPQVEESDLQHDLAEYQQELGELDTKLSGQETLFEEAKQIEARLHHARNQHDLERANGRLHDAWYALKEKRDQNLRSMAGNSLINLLQERAQTDQAPAVLSRARTQFSKITNGRYELKIDTSDRIQFTALDTANHRGYELDQLSSGSRIQLLLAVRLAFVEEQERDIQFPLLVDELLANSDDTRAAQIVNALQTIAESGRQIFYFTAQSDEVQKWRKVSAQQQVPIKEYRLTEADQPGGYALQTNGSDAIPNLITEVPDPDDLDHWSYGQKLGQPAADPTATNIEQLHIWYFVEEPEQIAALLQRNVDQWGPLRHLMIHDAQQLPEGLDPDQLTADARAIEEYLRLRQVGQPKPIDAGVLADSDAIRETFWDEVVEKMDELDGNPKALITALENGEVTNFRTKKRNELEQHLIQEGFLPRRDPLSPEERDTKFKAYLAMHPKVDPAHVRRIILRLEQRQPAESERTLFD